MNKTAIKNFAVCARINLIEAVRQKAFEYEIKEGVESVAGLDSVGGRLLSNTEKQQRRELIHQIQIKGFEQTMEEAAYTWFNRFIALRYMEVNGYLPSRVRVFSNEAGEFKPDILSEAMSVELDGLDREKVFRLLDKQDNEGLYKYLLITQCNALSDSLPRMFETIANWTELLFPGNLLKVDSVIGRMVSDIPEEDWTDQVQIIGWLYQFYNTELKAEVFGKSGKIAKNEIPAATQLFTPDWIVRYMVENSLGRLWIEHNIANTRSDDDEVPGDLNEMLLSKWKYYLPEAEQEPEVKAQLAEIRKSYKDITPESIKVIDPCMGSGHILVYAFDVLMDIYTQSGWNERDAAQSILKNNLFGLDIDDRAAQLAYFAVMMKARQYDRRILSRGIQPHVYAIIESNAIGGSYKLAMGDFLLSKEHQDTLNYLLDAFLDAKEYGSILQLEDRDYVGLMEAWKYTASQTAENFNMTLWYAAVEHEIPKFIEQAIMLTQNYDVVVTNPPYMAVSNAGAKLSDYVKKNFPDSKSDLFAVFIERCGQMVRENGYQAMITQHAWMFLSSFEKLRAKLLTVDIVNMAHLGARAFEEIGGEVVQTTNFVMCRRHIASYKGEYCRLIEPNTQNGKEEMFLAGENRYATDQSNFSKIPGSPVVYWISQNAFNICEQNRTFEDYATTRAGMITGNNNLFMRLWYEVSNLKFGTRFHSREDAQSSEKKWFPYNKGGEFRKWYGNNEYVVNWENDGFFMRSFKDGTGKIPAHAFNLEYIFKENVTWSSLSSYKYAARYTDFGFLYDASGSFADVKKDNLYYTLAFLCSNVTAFYLSAMNPTLNSLLPHNKLQLTEDCRILCDGQTTDGTDNRSKILSATHKGDVAVSYKTLLSMTKAEHDAFIGGAKVIYIYHNTIDAVGDKVPTEDRVFEACEEAITEIKGFVRRITNTFKGTNILITADHGFLYSYSPLVESDKTEKRYVTGEIVELERRYVLMRGECTAERMQRISMKHMQSDLIGFAPLQNIRIKKSGGGMNYVHGGISLQECVVPVITFKNMRSNSKNFVDIRKVSLQLISQSRKVSNSIFSLDFYQKEAVGGKLIPAEYEIYMSDVSGKAVSDCQKIIADKISTDGSDRLFRIRLTLRNMEFKKTQNYYLTIVEKETSNIVDKIEFTIDIAFTNDFDF